MNEERITFFSSYLKGFNLLFWSAVILIVGLHLVFFGSKLHVNFSLLGVVFMLGYYFLVRYISKSETNLLINDETLLITQENRFFNKKVDKRFHKDELRYVELAELKNSVHLIIYLNSGATYRYPLHSYSSQQVLKTYLTGKIKFFPAERRSYLKRFLFLLALFVLASTLNGILIFVLYTLIDPTKVNISQLHIYSISLQLFISTLCWYFCINRPLQNGLNGYARVNVAKLLGILFLTLTSFMVTSTDMLKKEAQPVQLTDMNDLYRMPRQSLFYLTPESDELHYLYYTSIANRGRRNIHAKITHGYLVPFHLNKSRDSLATHLWLVFNFYQQIRKTAPKTVKEEKFNQFRKKSLIDYSRTIKIKPVFYKLIHSDLNASLFQLDASKRIKDFARYPSPIFIFEPHWETLAAYNKKRERTRHILAFLYGFVALAYAGIAAKNR